MPPVPESVAPLLDGPLAAASLPWPFTLQAVLGDLRPRFLAKGAVGSSARAVARSGRVLLCADRPLAELLGRPAQVRLQTWHRSILPGEAPEPFGVLLCVRCLEKGVPPEEGPLFEAWLADRGEAGAELELDVGGLRVLAFQRLR